MSQIKILGLLLFASLITSCSKNQNKTTLEKNKTKEKIVLKREIVNNEFANTPLSIFDFKNTDLTSFFKGKYIVHKETTVNKYTDAIDTLIIYKKGKSCVRFYKNKEKIMLDSLNITDRDFVILRQGIDVGMAKKSILKLFKVNNIESFSDTILIIDDEGSASVELLFNNNKLKNVRMNPW